MELRKMNMLISDFLRDLHTVFPDSYELAQAKRLVDSAVALDPTGPIPVFFFLSGHDVPDVPTDSNHDEAKPLMDFPRPMLGLTTEAWDTLYKSCSDSNQTIIRRYLVVIERNIAAFSACTREIAARQNEMIKNDCFIQLKNLTSDSKYCDEFLADTSRMEQFIEKLLSTSAFADLRTGIMFIVERVMASPELLMKLAASASDMFSDNDEDGDSGMGMGGALSAIGGLAGIAGGDTAGLVSSIQNLIESPSVTSNGPGDSNKDSAQESAS